MDDEDLSGKRKRAEAAQWFARLKSRPVSQGTLQDYFAWRRQDGNAEAFEEAERLWTDAGEVGEHPSILRAIESAELRGRTRKKFAGSRGFVAVLALALLVGAVVTALHFAGTPGRDLATGAGEQRIIALADGSRLHLNADTQVNVRYASHRRQLTLGQGEALFSVAHDVTRPFTVTAGPVTVTAVGTKFEVMRLDGKIVVTLVEGRVDIRADDQQIAHLKPGEQWRLAGGRSSIAAVNTGNVTAWTQGRIVFEGASLASAITEVNRHNGPAIVLDANAMSGEKISGTFQAGDSDSFAEAVTALLPLQQRRDHDGRIHLIANESTGQENNSGH